MNHIIAFPSGPVTVDDAKEHTHRGVRFVTHSVLSPLNRFQQIRASEWQTGYGIPKTFAETHEEAEQLARKVIDEAGPQKLTDALSKLPTLNHVAEDQMGGIG